MFLFRNSYNNRKAASFFNQHRLFQSSLSQDLSNKAGILQKNTLLEQNGMKKYDHTGIETDHTSQNELWFIFRGETLFLQTQENSVTIPTSSALKQFNLPFEEKQHIGKHDSKNCFILNLPKTMELPALPKDMNFYPLREAHVLLAEKSIFSMLLKAIQISFWDKKTQFCGSCGTKTSLDGKMMAKACSDCGSLTFAQFSPAMLVLIWRNDEILLARSHTFPPGRYNILAGFVEPGETVEETVVREVKEEVGIEIKNLRYVASQPWPFPSNLMFGFTAEHAAGNICIDQEELDDAQWFSIDNLPSLPHSVSLSRQMVDAHIASRKKMNIQTSEWPLLKSISPKTPFLRRTTITALAATGLLMAGFWKPMKDYVQSYIEDQPKNRP